MTTWNELPNEICDLILRYVCAGIISDYMLPALDSFFNPSCLLHRAPSDPHPPRVLSQFTRVIRVCRYFYNSIMNTIKFEGKSTAMRLMGLQYRRLRTALLIHNHASPIDSRALKVLVRSIGLFWNNPLVLDRIPLTDLLSQIQTPDFPIIYRLFENWARHRRDPPNDQSNRIIFRFQNSSVSYLAFVIGSSNRYNDRWQICSIAAVLNTRNSDRWTSIPDLDSLPLLYKDKINAFHEIVSLLRDIVQAPPDTWWLLVDRCAAAFPRWYIWDSTITKQFYPAPSVSQSYQLNVGPSRADGEGRSQGLLHLERNQKMNALDRVRYIPQV